MTRWISRGIGLVCAVALGAVCTHGIARAQVNPIDNPGGLLQQGAKMAPDMGGVKHTPLPPALPGAASHDDTAAPATRAPTDMSPNDALFDAINRGDVAAARDALSRGAEVNARNVLGMTPMELSVDLGRNDISFLLLSYRESDGPEGAPPRAAGNAAAPLLSGLADKPSRTREHPVRATARVHGAVIREARREARQRTIPAPQRPRLFANDGGAPVPGSGFVGFGAGGSAR